MQECVHPGAERLALHRYERVQRDGGQRDGGLLRIAIIRPDNAGIRCRRGPHLDVHDDGPVSPLFPQSKNKTVCTRNHKTLKLGAETFVLFGVIYPSLMTQF